MTQENKELLLKDLCARLPYDIKCKIEMREGCDICTIYNINSIGFVEIVEDSDTNGVNIERIKPYLFPMSSMTEEQKEELSKLGVSYGEYALHDDTRGLGIMVNEAYIFFEFCYKHHIDFLGLIEMGLAIDATGLQVY